VGAGQAVTLDGKTLRGAKNAEGKQVHLLAAILHWEGVVVSQEAVADKSNEIPAVKPLLAELPLQGAVVTADAMHTQHETARFIVEEKHADYLFTAKDNQPTLRDDIATLGLNASPPQHETVDKGHGRIETRRIWCSRELQGYLDFPHHRQVVCVERHTTDLTGRPLRQETTYLITSLDAQRATPAGLLALNRGHWVIENSLHWVRDVTFGEDRSQVRRKSGPRLMATLRNLAISVFRLAGYRNMAQALRRFAAKPHLTLGLVGL
jgi:predicted transposase YbfD/YdcC